MSIKTRNIWTVNLKHRKKHATHCRNTFYEKSAYRGGKKLKNCWTNKHNRIIAKYNEGFFFQRHAFAQVAAYFLRAGGKLI